MAQWKWSKTAKPGVCERFCYWLIGYQFMFDSTTKQYWLMRTESARRAAEITAIDAEA